MRKKKIKREDALTSHHIIPKSRGGSGGDNLVRVKHRQHNFYHQLFRNKRPEEIVEYLVNYFWNGDWAFVDEAKKMFKPMGEGR